MKKSLLNMLTVALLVVNLVLSAVMVFSVMPASNKTNEMITKVCTALDLDLESARTANGNADMDINNLEEYQLSEKLTIPLKKKAENEAQSYVVVNAALILNNKHEDYEKYKDSLTTKETLVKDAIREVIGGFTLDELRDNEEVVQDAVLERLQGLFRSEFIVKVACSDWLFQ